MVNNNEYKVIIVGNISVGKTSLIKRLTTSEFSGDYKPTLGTDIYLYKTRIDGVESVIQLQIWDLAGSPNFAEIRKGFYRKADLISLVCDLTRKKTLEDLGIWITEIKSAYIDQMPTLFLLGNKHDLEYSRTVSSEDFVNFATKNKISFYKETSAKTGHNVKESFDAIAKHLKKG
jgi:small GTP-binding protein